MGKEDITIGRLRFSHGVVSVFSDWIEGERGNKYLEYAIDRISTLQDLALCMEKYYEKPEYFEKEDIMDAVYFKRDLWRLIASVVPIQHES